MPDDLRQQYEDAIRAACPMGLTLHGVLDAVEAVRDQELLRRQASIDTMRGDFRRQRLRAEQAEAAIDRAWDLVDDMRAESPQASTWADRLSVALSKQTGDDND